LFLSALGVLVIGHSAAAVELISVDIHAVAGNAPSNSVAINADGTFVAFYSDANDLVTGDRNGFRDVFVRNRQTHTTELVSVNDAGVQANADSHALGDAPAISGDGQVIAFYSDATNLVTGDGNGETDVFVRLRGSGQTQIASVATDGSQGNGPSLSPSITADARYVAFQSLAANLVFDDTNNVADIFVRDLVANTTERVCDQIQGNNYSYGPSISADGNFVAFTSAATNFVPHDTNNHLDVFVCNRQTGVIDLVSISTTGVQGNGDSVLPAISMDGRFVAFKSVASNLVPNDNNGVADVFVRDRLMGTTERVSVNTHGGDSDGASFPPSIDYSGRVVAFGSEADNLVPHDENGVSNVFARDRQSGVTIEVDLNDPGQQANPGTLNVSPSVSGDGTAVGFISLASNLVTNDFNGVSDVYLMSNPVICRTSNCPIGLVCSPSGLCVQANVPTATPTRGATATEMGTATPSDTPTAMPTQTPTITPTNTPTTAPSQMQTRTSPPSITPAITPTPSPTATVFCPPTAIPYCSDQCPPPATIVPGCSVSAGSPCIQNPQCASNEACVLRNDTIVPGCCLCATLTPTSTPTNTPAPPCVVGTSTSASCTESALDACLPGGGRFDGTVTFNCGGAATITVTSTKVISADTTIDGGSQVTISGGHSVGVFSVNAGVKFTVQNLIIANGNGEGGGGILSYGGVLIVSNSTFSGNSTPVHFVGGAISSGGTLAVANSAFSGNSAGAGGAIENYGTLTVTNSTFSGNSASEGMSGGGIDNSGTLTVTNSTFSDNSALFGGGIASNAGMLKVSITNSIFSGNSAGFGGGIVNEGTLALTNSTLSGNHAMDSGGGIYQVGGGSTLTITNSTLSGNSALVGGGIVNGGDRLTLTNTIVANSTSGGNCEGGIIDGGHNLEDGATCGFSTANGSSNNTNPDLDPAGLADNGGPTQTIALCTGPGLPSAGCTTMSPAIDAGDQSVCSTTTGAAPVDNLDQRGFGRPGTGAANCSIGAFEANATAGETCVGDCQSNGTVTIGDILTMVNIALGNTPVTACNAGDANHDGQITVDEILTAVNNALEGCAQEP